MSAPVNVHLDRINLYTQIQPLARHSMDRVFFANTDSEGPESTTNGGILAAQRAVKEVEARLAGRPTPKQTAVARLIWFVPSSYLSRRNPRRVELAASLRRFYFFKAELLVELIVRLTVDLDIRVDEVIERGAILLRRQRDVAAGR